MKRKSREKSFTIEKIPKIDFHNFQISWKASKSISWTFIQKKPPEVFCKDVLRNFAKFTGKHLCGVSFLIKLRFPVNFAKFLRTPFLTEHLWWLLLFIGSLHNETIVKYAFHEFLWKYFTVYPYLKCFILSKEII